MNEYKWIEEAATREDAAARYKSLVVEHHPDRYPEAEQTRQHLRMQEINEEYRRWMIFFDTEEHRAKRSVNKEQPATPPMPAPRKKKAAIRTASKEEKKKNKPTKKARQIPDSDIDAVIDAGQGLLTAGLKLAGNILRRRLKN